MKKNKLDHVDCEILNLLSKNGRMSVKDLANEVFLSCCLGKSGAA